MALNADFRADFSSFVSAAQKAESSLKGFQDNASKVEGALNRVSDSLSGVKIVQAATVAAEAVKRLGGDAGVAGGLVQLTDKELQRLGATAQEAAAKLRALGQKVPEDIQKIAAAAKAAAGSTDTLLSSVSKVAGAFGIAFGATAIISGIKRQISHVIELAGSIDDASKKLGVSAEKFQGWTAAAALSGGTADDVSTAVAFMNKTLDGGDKSTVDALKKAGLEFHAIRNLKPEDAFEAIAGAIKTIPDPMTQAKVAVELFGKGAATLLPAIKDDIAAVGAASEKMSDDTVKALDAAGDALTELEKHINIKTANSLGELALTLDELGKGAEGFKRIGKALAESMGQQDAYIKALVRLRTEAGSLSDVQKKLIDAFLREGKDVTYIAGLWKAELTPAIRAYIDAQTAAPPAIHKTADELKAEEDALKKSKAAAEAHRKEIQALADVYTGKKLADEVKKINEAMVASGGIFAMTDEGYKKFKKDLDDLVRQGAHLPPVLLAIWSSTVKLTDIVKQVDLGFKNLNKDWPEVKLGADNSSKSFTSLLASTKQVSDLISEMGGSALPALQYAFGKVDTSKPKKDVDTLGAGLRDLSQAFANFAQVDGAFGGSLKVIGSLVSEVSLLKTGIDSINKITASKKPGEAFGVGDIAAIAAGYATLVFALLDLALKLDEASRKAEHLRFVAGERLRIGLEFTGLETARVAVATVEAIRSSWELLDASLRKPGKYDTLAALAALPGNWTPAMQNAAAEALNLSKILADLGGLTFRNITDAEQKAGVLFNVIALGGEAGATGQKELNSLVGQFVDFADKAGGLWDANLQKIIADAKATGVELQSINDAIAKQQSILASAITGLTGKVGAQAGIYTDLKKAVTEAQKSYDDLVASGADQDKITAAANALAKAQESVKDATVTTQDEFDRLSRIALNTFNTLVASGKSPVDAMLSMGTSIDDLIANMGAFGLSGNAAYDALSRWRDLTKNNEALLNEVASLNTLLTATANLGGLNADAFADLQAQGVEAYKQLIAAGFTQQEAETAEKGFLENIIKLHKDKGLAIDDATKALIDQARADGVLGEQEESTQQVLKEGLGAIITLLKGDLPAAWQKNADAAKRAAKETQTAWDEVDIQVPINYTYHTSGEAPELPDGVPVFPQAKGGDYYVKRPTLFLAGEAGPERVSFSGAGKAGSGASVTIDARGSFFPDRQSLHDLADMLVPHIPDGTGRRHLNQR